MPNWVSLAYIITEIGVLPDGHGEIDSVNVPGQEYIYFMGSTTAPSVCYIHLQKVGIPCFDHF